MNAGSSNESNISENSIFAQIQTDLKSDIIKEVLKQKCKDSKTKISEEAVELIKEITKAMIVEAAIRSAKQAQSENKTTISISHVETMLLQLMLDFP